MKYVIFYKDIDFEYITPYLTPGVPYEITGSLNVDGFHYINGDDQIEICIHVSEFKCCKHLLGKQCWHFCDKDGNAI